MEAVPSANETAIFAKHSFTPTIDEKLMTTGYSVYEMGEPSSLMDIESIASALGIIDQYSGGALTGSRVVLVNGVQWQNNRNASEILGINAKHATYINMTGIHKLAVETGVDVKHLTATVLVHEVLGHGLERRLHGETGKFFPEHFEYSEEFTTGAIFNSIHETIRARDEKHDDSLPVREYGAVTPAEDLATTVDALVARAEGWEMDKMPRFASQVDEYRSDLVTQLMVDAAENVRGLSGNPGFVGGELRFDTDEQGNVIGSHPARTLKHTVLGAQAAFDQEIKYIANKLTPREVIVRQEVPLV